MQEFASTLKLFYETQDNQVRNQAEINIQTFKQENYSLYLQSLILLPTETLDRVIGSACLIFLFQEVKYLCNDKCLFLTPDIQNNFWPELSRQIIPIFQASHINPVHKKFLSIIIGIISNYGYKTYNNTEIQEFLIELFQKNEDQVIYFLPVFSEMISITPSLCGIEAKIYLTIINKFIKNQELFISSCKLFFSVASCYQEEIIYQEFQEIIQYAIENIDQLDKFIEIMSNFAIKNSIFFAPILDCIIPFICEYCNPVNSNLCICSLNFLQCLNIGGKDMIKGAILFSNFDISIDS